MSQSLFAQLVVGALLSGGVPLLVGIFHLNSPAGLWSFGTPPWLQNPALLLYPDLWGGVVVPIVFLFLTSTAEEPAAPLAFLHGTAFRATTTEVLGHLLPRRPTLFAEKPSGNHGLPYLSQREAKAVSAMVLFAVLAIPIVLRHLAAERPPAVPAPKEGKVTKAKPAKAAKAAKAEPAKATPGASPAKPAPGASAATSTATAASSTPGEAPAPRKRGRPKKLP